MAHADCATDSVRDGADPGAALTREEQLSGNRRKEILGAWSVSFLDEAILDFGQQARISPRKRLARAIYTRLLWRVPLSSLRHAHPHQCVSVLWQNSAARQFRDDNASCRSRIESETKVWVYKFEPPPPTTQRLCATNQCVF